MSNLNCDFCNLEKPEEQLKRYVCESFTQVIIADGRSGQLDSNADWAACNECSALINANDLEGLLDRAVKYQPEISDASDFAVSMFREVMRNLFQSFFKYRMGLN